MTRGARLVLFLAGAAVVSVLLWSGFGGLSAFGTAPAVYRTAVLQEAVPARHATSAVATVVFDVRGFDTLGEDFILFASVIGVVLLLRLQREEHEAPSRDRAAEGQLVEASDAIRAVSFASSTLCCCMQRNPNPARRSKGGWASGSWNM